MLVVKFSNKHVDKEMKYGLSIKLPSNVGAQLLNGCGIG